MPTTSVSESAAIRASPAILLVLLLASFVAFALARYTWWFNVPLLMLFTAGNLLPQQILIMPLYEMYKRIPLPMFLSDSGPLYHAPGSSGPTAALRPNRTGRATPPVGP